MRIGMDASPGDMLVPDPMLIRYAFGLFDCAAASVAKQIQLKNLNTTLPFSFGWIESNEGCAARCGARVEAAVVNRRENDR